jgi:EmrB/QacA subfamily drug resistance transporter
MNYVKIDKVFFSNPNDILRSTIVEFTQTRVYKRRWIGLAFLGAALLIISLDNTVLNVALPSIANDLGASASGLQWIVDSYTLVFAALLLTAGSMGDRLGRKKALLTGLLVFGAGSLACALSVSEGMLIGCRAFLGIGGAIIMPSTLSIITATFRDPKERAQAIAIWAGTFGLGMGVGPVIAGSLLAHFHWSSVFYVNLPIVLIGLIGTYFFVQDSRDDAAPRADVPGLLLSIGGLFALIYGIIQAGREGWTATSVIWSLVIAVILLGVFAWREKRAANPMLPLAFFKNMSFTGANIAMTLVMFAMFGSLFFLGQYFQSVQGYSPFQAGLRLLPMAPVMMFMAVSSARIARRIGTKVTVSIGIMLAAAGLFYFSRVAQVDTAYPLLLIAMMVLSTGMAMAMSPATNSIMGSVPVRKAGVGSAMNNTARQVGGALGVAVLGTLMNNIYVSKVGAFTNNLQVALPPQVLDSITSGIQTAHIAAQHISNSNLSRSIVDVTSNAFVSGMKEALLVGSIIIALASLTTLVILPSRVQPPAEEKEEGKTKPR